MISATADSIALREAISEHRDELDAVLQRYQASNPRLFGSVARGDATASSDIDVLVDLDPTQGRLLMRLGGITEGFRRVLGQPVDVVTADVLRDRVSATASADAVPL